VQRLENENQRLSQEKDECESQLMQVLGAGGWMMMMMMMMMIMVVVVVVAWV
jgi:hypothetical protein